MDRYVVRFFKTLLSGNGHDTEICQHWYEVEAPNESAAIAMAKKEYCAAAHVADWSCRADRVEAALADFLS